MHLNCKKFFLVTIIALALASIGPISLADENKPSEDRIAVVNGSVITQEDFNREMSRAQQQIASMGQTLNDSQLSEIKKEVLRNLINLELLYQASQENGIKVDEEAINEQLKALKKRFPNEAEFKDALSKKNLSEEAIKSQIGQGMAIQKFIDEKVTQKITVSDKETKAYYDSHPDFFKEPEQVQASHILIKVEPKFNESQKAEAREKIETIQQKLQEGGDFAALAKEFSECPSSEKGGDLGFFKRGQMVKPFEDAAFTLEPNKTSDIVETRFGYHLIKTIDKRPETTIPYKDIKDKLEQYLKQEKVKNEIKLYVDKLREKAKVEIFLNEGNK